MFLISTERWREEGEAKASCVCLVRTGRLLLLNVILLHVDGLRGVSIVRLISVVHRLRVILSRLSLVVRRHGE